MPSDKSSCREDGIDVFADDDRRLAVADPTGWAVRIACGAALFNLRLAFAVHGHTPLVRLRPEPRACWPGSPLAVVPPTPAEQHLYAAIPRRHSNRAPFAPQPVPAAVRAQLLKTTRDEAAWLDLLIGPAAVGAVAEIAHSANAVLNRDPRYVEELAAWTRPDAAAHHMLPRRPFAVPESRPDPGVEPEPLVAILGTAGTAVHLCRCRVSTTDVHRAGAWADQAARPVQSATSRGVDRGRGSSGRA